MDLHKGLLGIVDEQFFHASLFNQIREKLREGITDTQAGGRSSSHKAVAVRADVSLSLVKDVLALLVYKPPHTTLVHQAVVPFEITRVSRPTRSLEVARRGKDSTSHVQKPAVFELAVGKTLMWKSTCDQDIKRLTVMRKWVHNQL